jgi:tRNA(Ile)-lysidine synthase
MPRHPASANRLGERIRAAIRRTVRAAGVTRFVVACSGGADSTCLAHAAAHVAREQSWSLVVAHVRHRLRPDDEIDARNVARLAEGLSVPFAVRELAFAPGARPTNNIEATLRAARYAALAAIANEHAAPAILTGHTLDDQGETLLLHLLRGSGSNGLAGIAERGDLPIPDAHTALHLLRPLLAFRRDETHAYCAAHHLQFVHDATNDDDRFSRNWLRHRVMPLLQERYPALPAALARTATSVADEDDYLHQQALAAFATYVRRSETDCFALDCGAFRGIHPAVQRRVLREVAIRLTGAVQRMDDIERLRRAAVSPSRTPIRVGTLVCHAVHGEFVVRLYLAAADDSEMPEARTHD